jgi:alanine racemase
MYRPTWVNISRAAFLSNVRQLKSYVGPSVKLCAVLKADAYGHGAGVLAPVAIEGGADFIGVSSIEEGLELRRANFTAPILILGGIYPFENYELALELDLTPTVASFESATALEKIATERGKRVKYHLEVDTGMGRLGVSLEEAKRILDWESKQPRIHLEGIYSHLSSADSDPAFTRSQIQNFLTLKNHLTHPAAKEILFHLANSAGLLGYKESHLDLVRPGLALYGYSVGSIPKSVKLSPVLSWHTKVVFLKTVPPNTPISYGQTFRTSKETLVATLPVGYADGIPRAVSNKGNVIIQEKRCPILGRVTMDQIMADVTGLSVNVGDEVMLLGSQGQEQIDGMEWASWVGTIPYEIFCGISKRVPRIWT